MGAMNRPTRQDEFKAYKRRMAMNTAEQVIAVRKHGEEIITLLKDTTVDIGIMACLDAATKMIVATTGVPNKEAVTQLIDLLGKLREAER